MPSLLSSGARTQGMNSAVNYFDRIIRSGHHLRTPVESQTKADSGSVLMHHRFLRFITAGASGLAISAAILFTAFVVGLWFGGHSDNLWVLLKLTVAYALLLAFVAAAWPGPNGRRGTKSPFIL